MKTFDPTPASLLIRLILYFALFFGSAAVVVTAWPDTLQFLPFGGHHALDFIEVEEGELTISLSTSGDEQEPAAAHTLATDKLWLIIFFVSMHLFGTILLMIPIAWTYMATKQEVGYGKNFVHTLITLPICATTIVLLIQDSLALAFGLAALVAAVRFRVSLDEAIDGIYIFAAVCVGLAAGIGFLGIAAVMAIFFCFSNVLLWQFDVGENPVEQLQQARKRAKLTQPNE